MEKLNWIDINIQQPKETDEVICTNGKSIFVGQIRFNESEKLRYHSEYNAEYLAITNITHWLLESELLETVPK